VPLLILMAARPWRVANDALGLVPPPVEQVTGLDQDTLLMQPVNIVLPQSAVDTLTMRVAQKDSLKLALKQQSKAVDREIATLEKKITLKQKAIQKQQENLITLEEIYDLADKQANRGKEGKEYP
jgi:hypothetical protein